MMGQPEVSEEQLILTTQPRQRTLHGLILSLGTTPLADPKNIRSCVHVKEIKLSVYPHIGTEVSYD